jgi:hypothetical protein
MFLHIQFRRILSVHATPVDHLVPVPRADALDVGLVVLDVAFAVPGRDASAGDPVQC